MDDLTQLRLDVARCLGWEDINEGPKSMFSGRPPFGDVVEPGWKTWLPDWPNDDGAAARDLLPAILERGWEIVICTLRRGVGWCVDILDVGINPAINEGKLALPLCRAFVAACAAAELTNGG